MRHIFLITTAAELASEHGWLHFALLYTSLLTQTSQIWKPVGHITIVLSECHPHGTDTCAKELNRVADLIAGNHM